MNAWLNTAMGNNKLKEEEEKRDNIGVKNVAI